MLRLCASIFDAQLPTAIGDSCWPTCIKRDGLDEGDVEAYVFFNFIEGTLTLLKLR